ncbi:MAG: hypothetical protein WCB94_12375 [Terriglobales bacterium]
MGRLIGFVGTVVTLAIGMYIYSLQVKTLTPGAAGGNSGDVVTITGVKNDLIGIANAERGYLATEGKYASLDELKAGNYITMKAERPPYVYDVETTSSSFRATATRTTKGAPSQLWITETMQVEASD